MIFFDFSDQNLLFDIQSIYSVLTEIKDKSCVIDNLMRNFIGKVNLIVGDPHKQLWTHAFQKTHFFNSFFKGFSPMLALIEHFNGGLNFFLDPVNYLMIDVILFFILLFMDSVQIRLGVVYFLSFPWDSIIEALPALDLMSLIFLSFDLHFFDQLLVLFFRNILILVIIRLLRVRACNW